MVRKTIENCTVIKKGRAEGDGTPLTEILNDKEYCQGYQKSEYDDEPHERCKGCFLNVYYENL